MIAGVKEREKERQTEIEYRRECVRECVPDQRVRECVLASSGSWDKEVEVSAFSRAQKTANGSLFEEASS